MENIPKQKINFCRSISSEKSYTSIDLYCENENMVFIAISSSIVSAQLLLYFVTRSNYKT